VNGAGEARRDMPGSFELAAFTTAITGGALFVARRRLEKRLNEAELAARAQVVANEHLWAQIQRQEQEIAMLNFELDGQEPELEPDPAPAPAPVEPALPPVVPVPPAPPQTGGS